MNNIFKNIPSNLDSEAFNEILSNDSLKIERIISKGQCSPEHGWYQQTQNEWLILLQGAATLTFDDNRELHLKPGDYLNIPAKQRHKVSWTAPDIETIWLTVHY
mgnify:CR=1 FL=1